MLHFLVSWSWFCLLLLGAALLVGRDVYGFAVGGRHRVPLGGPVGAEEFGPGQDGLGGLLLFVGRVVEVSEDAFHHGADFGAAWTT